MEFDITNLDKTLVIQTLYFHSAPLSYGKMEYDFRKKKGDNVDGLSVEECENILFQYNHIRSGIVGILDYHKGKPMKLIFEKKNNGRVLVESDKYDSHNGKFRFLEAFLNVFELDEIFITKKGYRHYVMSELQERLVRPKEQEALFKFIIKNTIEKEYVHGKYWLIDKSIIKYESAFMP